MSGLNLTPGGPAHMALIIGRQKALILELLKAAHVGLENTYRLMTSERPPDGLIKDADGIEAAIQRANVEGYRHVGHY